MKSARSLNPESWDWHMSALMGWRGFSERLKRSWKRYVGRSDGLTAGRSDWDSGEESLWPGLLRRDPTQTRPSSCRWVGKKHFSLHSPSPFFHSTPIPTVVSASSASAHSAHSRRFQKKRSRHSSAQWEGDCGDLPPATSQNPSKDASHPIRSCPRSHFLHRSGSAICSCTRSTS